MREYETVVITQPNITDAEQVRINERISSLIERHNGRLFFARSMGKRGMAYPIKKQTKGYYTCYDFAADGKVIGEVERDLRINENVFRFLTVVKNEDVDIEARAAEIIARGEDASVTQEEVPSRIPLKADADVDTSDAGVDGDADGDLDGSNGTSGKEE